MKKTLTLGTLSFAVATLLVGCGSSSSSETPATSTPETSTGYFIDSAVANVEYNTTSGVSGTTDKFGRFQYKEGDQVKLYIGNLLLGEASPTEEGLVTPKALSNSDAEKEALLLRLLQSLDADNNASNGIIIPPSVVTALEGIEETSMEENNESSLIDVFDTALTNNQLGLDTDFDGQIDVSEDDAKNHANESEQAWDEGERPDAGHEDEPLNDENGDSHGNGGKDNNNSETHGNGEENNSTETSHGDDFNLSTYPMSTLTPALKDTLSYMGNEERLAYDVYHNLYTYHVTESATEVKQLKNISEKSEIKHIGMVQDLVNRYNLNAEDFSNVIDGLALRDKNVSEMPSGEYDVPAIQNLYNILYAKGVASTTEALMVGCMVEVTDVNDLDKYILLAKESNASDIVDSFDILRKGSYNHYWAFDKGLKNAGVANGCFVEGDALLTNKEGIYPQNEHESGGSSEETHGNGNGNGQGQGQGQRND